MQPAAFPNILPRPLPEPVIQARKGLLYGAAITYIISGGNPAATLLGGIMGATAALVQIAIAPILQRHLGNCHPFVRGFASSVIILSLTALTLNTLFGVVALDVVRIALFAFVFNAHRLNW